jgi:uracil-DNA glycosylase
MTLEKSWQEAIGGEFDKTYMQNLKTFLREEKDQKKVIFPHSSKWFEALNLTPLDKVKVVILGQDPYHGVGQAHGLCFSVLPPVSPPPSLVNIYKELASDVGFVPPSHGLLEEWAKQGVLLLNATLTVEMAKAGSHQKKGWEEFTDVILKTVSSRCVGVVFLLWGSYAQKKEGLIDTSKHCILKAPHPSPLSSYRGFFGCKHFSKTNEYLTSQGKIPINWQLPEEV